MAKELVLYCWMMFDALEMKALSGNALTSGRKLITVGIMKMQVLNVSKTS